MSMMGGVRPPVQGPSRPNPNDKAAQVRNQLQGGAGPKEWRAFTPAEQRRIVETFNAMYGSQARRRGGYNPANPGIEFFNDPLVVRNLDSIVRAAIPYAVTYPTGPAPPPRNSLSIFGARTQIQSPVPTATAEANLGDVQRAVAADGRSANYMQLIIAASHRHKVPWQVLWSVLRAESGFNPTAMGRNSNGTTDNGIAQINSIHGVPRRQAENPAFAIDWAARYLRTGYDSLVNKDWTLAALYYNGPDRAKTLSETGKSKAGWANEDKKYLQRVFALTDQIGWDPKVDGKLDFVMGQDGAGAMAQPKFPLPDPVAVRQKAGDYLRSLFLREPTERELNEAVGLVNGIVSQANAEAASAQGSVANPFASPMDAAPGGDGGLHHPIPGAPRTSRFGMRLHPLSGKRKMHSGTDWAAPQGTPVRAAVTGRVVFAGKKGGYGNTIDIEGDDGRIYRYAHLHSMQVAKGDQVVGGSAIGGVGSTGNSTGNHLHFEIRQGDQAIDPETILAADDRSPAPTPATSAPAAPADAHAHEGEAPAPGGAPSGAPAVAYDEDARLVEHIKSQPEYKELYGNKPGGMSEQEYAQQFTGLSQELTGVANLEAARAGMQTGQAATTAGLIAGDPKSMEQRTFRQRMFEAAELVSRMI